MSAFRRARERWRADVIELDAKLTKDDVPVVIHDDSLDRTTNCTGRVRDKLLAEVRACVIDRLGTDAGPEAEVEIANPTERVPTLAEVLDWARAFNQPLNLEIKNLPTDSDFDPGDAYADRILDEVLARQMQDLVIIQSFWPDNLARAEQREPRIVTSFLTLNQTNEGAIAFSRANGFDVLSPQWRPSSGGGYFDGAKAAGLPVIPWTLDTADAIREAEELGADGVITNDMAIASRALGRAGVPVVPKRKPRRCKRGKPRRSSASTHKRGHRCPPRKTRRR